MFLSNRITSKIYLLFIGYKYLKNIPFIEKDLKRNKWESINFSSE